LREALESDGYSVLEDAGGREGVRLYRGGRPNFVFVELAMAGEIELRPALRSWEEVHRKQLRAAIHAPRVRPGGEAVNRT
jgi:CheY-like chemotaxis protein